MLFQLLFFTLLLAFFVAKFEINIEGQNGWAKSLPTWREPNKLTKLVFGDYPLTGYHFWLGAVILAVFHFPFLFVPWTIYHEFQVLAMLAAFVAVEDCLWFILNPAFGIHKFDKAAIPWHKKWVGPVPQLYIRMLLGFIVFLGLSVLVS